MHSDFEPVHLKQANAKMDKYLSSSKRHQKHDECNDDDREKRSLWKKFLGLFRSNPFELPEDLYKYK